MSVEPSISQTQQVAQLVLQTDPSGVHRGTSQGHQVAQAVLQGEPSLVLRYLVLASDSTSVGMRDFEGFLDPLSHGQADNPWRSRSSSQSERSHKGHHRRRHPSSSSSLSSSSLSRSPSPKHSRRYHSKRSGNSETLSQILNILPSMSRSTAPPQEGSRPQPSQSQLEPDPGTEPGSGSQNPASRARSNGGRLSNLRIRP